MKIFFLTLLLISQTAIADLNVKIHFSPLANLVYQMDCLSDAKIHCSRDAFQNLWDQEFLKTNEDRELLNGWSHLNDRYRVSVDIESENEKSEKMRLGSIQLNTKLRLAALQSADREEYLSRLDLLILPKDRREFEKILRHFEPRFQLWWEKVASPFGRKFARETELLLKSKKISDKIKQYSRFYEAELPEDYIIHFNLFYRPDFKGSSAGQQIENYSISEFLPIEKPIDRIDVIIHELCHFFYSSGRHQKFLALRDSFLKRQSREAIVAYSLLNEALATTFGNGIINKVNMDKERWEAFQIRSLSFYNNEFIDRAAKEILPWIETWLNEGRTLYDPDFVSRYLTSLTESFGSDLVLPRLLLNEAVLVVDGDIDGKFKDLIRKRLNPSSLYVSHGAWSDPRTLKTFREFPQLSALIIVHPKNIKILKSQKILEEKDYKQLRGALKKSKKGLFSFKRNGYVPVYVIVGSESKQVEDFVSSLAAVKQEKINDLQ